MRPPDSTPPAAGETGLSGLVELLRAADTTVRGLLDACTDDDPMREGLEDVHSAMRRVAALTGHVDARSLRGRSRATSLDLNTVVRQLAPSLQRLLGPFICLETELESRGLWASIDRGDIDQVVLGLVINAREALPLGGTVGIGTRLRQLERASRHRIGELAPGTWAVLEVAKGGAGMDECNAKHLFEPSLPGLPVDSSLSLATVAAIVRHAGGQMLLDTTPAGGTVLAACLPAVQRPVSRQPTSAAAGAVLVVDDDEWIRRSAACTLRRAGYGVLEAEHAEAALELLGDVAGSCVSLVVMDHQLGTAGLRPLGERLRQDRPDVHLLVTTRPLARAVGAGDHAVLEKPFTPEALLRAVGERLTAPR